MGTTASKIRPQWVENSLSTGMLSTAARSKIRPLCLISKAKWINTSLLKSMNAMADHCKLCQWFLRKSKGSMKTPCLPGGSNKTCRGSILISLASQLTEDIDWLNLSPTFNFGFQEIYKMQIFGFTLLPLWKAYYKQEGVMVLRIESHCVKCCWVFRRKKKEISVGLKNIGHQCPWQMHFPSESRDKTTLIQKDLQRNVYKLNPKLKALWDLNQLLGLDTQLTASQ